MFKYLKLISNYLIDPLFSLNGCQNYDDQFSELETQIVALARTVTGLSQVQSDINSLANTVNSLSSTVKGPGDQFDNALEDGLADIAADLANLESATKDVASAEDVAAIQENVAEIHGDLDELLANSSVFTGNVEIDISAILDVFNSMGNSINIVNGSVTINYDDSMDKDKMQDVIDNILTVKGDFSFTYNGTTEFTFNKLTSVKVLELNVNGGSINFEALTSATSINVKYTNYISLVNLPVLTSCERIYVDTQSYYEKKDGKNTYSTDGNCIIIPNKNVYDEIQKQENWEELDIYESNSASKIILTSLQRINLSKAIIIGSKIDITVLSSKNNDDTYQLDLSYFELIKYNTTDDKTN